jgi:hypothetical protein
MTLRNINARQWTSAFDPSKLYSPSFDKAQIPKWLDCAMGAHENLARGLIGASGALFASWLAWSAVRDQIALEQASNEPEVEAYILPDRIHIHFLSIIVTNVGRAAARNVSIELDIEQEALTACRSQLPAKVKIPILSVMPKDERVQLFFLSYLEAGGQPPPDFNIYVQFVDDRGAQRKSHYRASKKIAKEVERWTSGSSRLKVETGT